MNGILARVGGNWNNNFQKSQMPKGGCPGGTLKLRFDRYISLVQNFKKPLDIFSPQIERKRSKEYFVIILAVKESFERFSCHEFIFEKSKHREAGLKHKLEDSGCLETLLILVFVNENCCLCICFTEFYFFY